MVSEDIKAKLSFKGLEEAGQQHPLIKFKGVLQSYDPQPPNERGRVRVLFHFSDIEVIESREPYPFPLAEIGINYSTRKRSSWGVLAGSVGKVNSDLDVPDLVGKGQEWHNTPGHQFGENRETGEQIVASCWEVMAVEGVDTGPQVSAYDKMLEILDGATIAEFNQKVFADPVIKADGQLQSSILDQSLIPGLIAAGVATVDADGKHHVVKA